MSLAEYSSVVPTNIPNRWKCIKWSNKHSLMTSFHTFFILNKLCSFLVVFLHCIGILMLFPCSFPNNKWATMKDPISSKISSECPSWYILKYLWLGFSSYGPNKWSRYDLGRQCKDHLTMNHMHFLSISELSAILRRSGLLEMDK